MLEYNKAKGHSLEVLNTLTNEITNFDSIRQAAEKLDCSHTTIRRVLISPALPSEQALKKSKIKSKYNLFIIYRLFKIWVLDFFLPQSESKKNKK